MSKHSRKASHKHQSIKPTPHKKNIKTDMFLIVLTIILASTAFGLGKYFEFNTPGAFDSGAYVYSAAHILDGAKIGIEEKPSARLGTLLVNMLGVKLFGYNELGPELIQTFLQAAAMVLMFIAMRKLYCTLAASVGTFIAVFYLSAPLIAKFGNVKEQYMIAFMVISISFFVLYQLSNKWFYAIAAGAFASWAPLFKPTGTTVIGAIGLFVLLQPVLKNRTIKQTVTDILLLLAGTVLAIGPLYIWILGWHVQLRLPYTFAWNTIAKMIPSSAQGALDQAIRGYVAGGRKLVPFSQQWPIVLRYYKLLILPIALALASITAWLIKLVSHQIYKTDGTSRSKYDHFVLLLSVWWILDMAFVWISPRSYEQYYLPLNASAAMLGGYAVALYSEKLHKTNQKLRWRTIGCIGLIVMIAMGWHIFFGIETSPHTGRKYGQKSRGYAQKLKEISSRRKNKLKGPWEIVGAYINAHSEPKDKIYVWGWWPGIYVQAQRFSSASIACLMPRPAPQQLAKTIEQLLAEFQKEMPKFIVDSRKKHIPTNWPAYELWPIMPQGYAGLQKEAFLPRDEKIVAAFDKNWSAFLRKNYGDDEADRYELLKPFRQFITEHYEIAERQHWINLPNGRLVHRMFGVHVVFRLKDSASK